MEEEREATASGDGAAISAESVAVASRELAAIEAEPTSIVSEWRVEQIRALISAGNAALESGIEHYCRAGELLWEQKETLGHGEWLPWVHAHAINARTAQRAMKIAANTTRVSHAASQRQALALLAKPQPTTKVIGPSKRGERNPARPVPTSTEPNFDALEAPPVVAKEEEPPEIPPGWTRDAWGGEIAARRERRRAQAGRNVFAAVDAVATAVRSSSDALAPDEKLTVAKTLRNVAEQLDPARAVDTPRP